MLIITFASVAITMTVGLVSSLYCMERHPLVSIIKMSVLKPLLGASVSILLLSTGLGQGFGLISIDRLNKYEDVFYENNGIKTNSQPIELKCIPHDKDASLNDPCKHFEESLNQHLKMVMSETQGDWTKITGNSSIDSSFDPSVNIISIRVQCSINLVDTLKQDPIIHEACIHLEETLNQHYKVFMTDTQADRLKITGME